MPIKILIVEDELIVYEDLRHRVQALGYQVLGVAVTGEEAIVKAHLLRPDVVLMDIGLLGPIDGVEAARRILVQEDIPVVYATAYADDATLERAKATGPFGYVLKPFDERELHTTIEIALVKHASEKVLRASEEHFRRLASASFEGLLITDGDRIVDASEQMGRLSGCELAELEGKDFFQLIAPESRDIVRTRMLSDTGRTIECIGLRRDGASYPAEIRTRAIPDVRRALRVTAIRDVTERKKMEDALLHRALLQEFISKISARFISLAAERVESEIEEVLRELAGFIHVDRCFLHLFSGDGARIAKVYEWHDPSREPHATRVEGTPVGEFAWFMQKIQRFETICIYRIADLPVDAGRDRERWLALGIRSLLAVPLVSEAVPTGYFGFTAEQGERTWPGEDISLITLLGDMFAHVLSREATRRQLQESEERYRRITSAVTNYVYSVRVQNGQPVETTHGPGCTAVTGYTTTDFADDPHLWIHMVPDEDRPSVLEQARRILAGEPVQPIEHRMWRKDGTTIWVRNTPVRHYDKNGILVDYDGVIQDVTERVTAQQKLQASEEMYRLLVENLHEVIFKLDLKGLFTYASKVIEDVAGYTPEEIVGEHFTRFVHPHDRPGLEATWERPTGGLMGDNEFRILSREGNIRRVRVSGRLLYDGEDAIGVLGTLTDITDRKEAESALRESERRFREILSTITLSTVILDLHGILVFCNDRFLGQTGWQRHEVIGKNWINEFVAPAHREEIRVLFSQRLQGGSFPQCHEHGVLLRGGAEQLISWNSTVLRDPEGTPTGVLSIGTEKTPS